MALADRVARWRVALGFAMGAAVLVLARPTTTTLLAGVPIALAGETLRVWAAGHLNKAREVTSSGPYRWLAHPLYVGSSVIGIGVAVACGRAVVVALVAAYLGVMLTAAIRSEEAFLRRRFGDRYDRYRVGAATESGRRFSLRQARANHEPRTVAGVLAAILLLVAKAAYNGLFWRAQVGR